MKTKNVKIAGLVFTETGVMIEKPYCNNNDELKGQRRIKEEHFKGELLEIAKRLAKARMAHCYREVHENLAVAQVITAHHIIWKDGHFEVPVWKELEAILSLDDVRELNSLQCQQLVRSIMFNTDSYWLPEYNTSTWTTDTKADPIIITAEFKMFITEQFLVGDAWAF